MKTNADAKSSREIINLEIVPKLKRAPAMVLRQRFRVRAFTNRGGTESWRVEGTPRNGQRIRENFADQAMAQQRQVQLESEYWTRTEDSEAARRATKLTDIQLRLCEAALFKLDCDDDLLPAVEHWLRHGKHNAVTESPRLDDAFEKFKAWLDGAADENGNGRCTLREHSRTGPRVRVNAFCNSVPNMRVNDVTPDVVQDFLDNLKLSPVTRDNYRRDISGFFKWCIQRPRRWTLVNPCTEAHVDKAERRPPTILTVEQCKALLKAAEPNALAPYVAVCLFGGLRPFETSRLTWDAVNLKDREIRLEANQTKTGRARVVTICDTLLAWLKAYKGQPFFPLGWHKRFRAVKRVVGFGTPEDEKSKLKAWQPDVMRHTAISHYFRKTGSYGQTAEQFGNSEAIIKNHYQGRVSSDDTKKFYALKPTKGAAK